MHLAASRCYPGMNSGVSCTACVILADHLAAAAWAGVALLSWLTLLPKHTADIMCVGASNLALAESESVQLL